MPRTIVGLLAVLSAAAALPVAAAAQRPPRDNRVTLSADPNPIKFGKTTTLAGKVTGPDHSGVAVTLRADPFPVGADTNVATATTGANGDFQFTAVKPDRSTRYSVRARTSPPVESAVVDVLVRVRVRLRIGDRTPRVGKRVRFYGSAAPQHDGSVVRIQRRRASGSWKTVALTLLRDAGDERSRYSRRVRIRRDGTYRARVIAVDGDHLSGTSRRRSVEVH